MHIREELIPTNFVWSTLTDRNCYQRIVEPEIAYFPRSPQFPYLPYNISHHRNKKSMNGPSLYNSCPPPRQTSNRITCCLTPDCSNITISSTLMAVHLFDTLPSCPRPEGFSTQTTTTRRPSTPMPSVKCTVRQTRPRLPGRCRIPKSLRPSSLPQP